MPAQIRPNLKLAKIAYKILQTPKELQQKDIKRPTKREVREWATTTPSSY